MYGCVLLHTMLFYFCGGFGKMFVFICVFFFCAVAFAISILHSNVQKTGMKATDGEWKQQRRRKINNIKVPVGEMCFRATS